MKREYCARMSYYILDVNLSVIYNHKNYRSLTYIREVQIWLPISSEASPTFCHANANFSVFLTV